MPGRQLCQNEAEGEGVESSVPFPPSPVIGYNYLHRWLISQLLQITCLYFCSAKPLCNSPDYNLVFISSVITRVIKNVLLHTRGTTVMLSPLHLWMNAVLQSVGSP